ncbi:MAG: translation initiation factor IF-2 [Deltaproteobacteria bacterium CG11_big_fil_rev_8_21_14_0_20_47_16]|nr:MAG: translation initiation factor IF-2 [Deltaproteobacteria bacterium CG11_big_fil_rev_8_21_14_0_20_47_16]
MVTPTHPTSSTEGSADSPKMDVVEKRLKPTLIRRRAKAVEPEASAKAPVKAEEMIAEKDSPPAQAEAPREVQEEAVVIEAPRATETVAKPVAATQGVRPSIESQVQREAREAREKEALARKAPKKKKSRDEWVMEDIKRAGGLKQFAETIVASGEISDDAVAAPVVPDRVERIFEPSLVRRRKSSRREFKKTKVTTLSPAKRVIKVENSISVSELSQAMGVKGGELIKKLIGLGIMVTINQSIDFDTATLLATDYGFEIERAGVQEDQLLAKPKKAAASGEGAIARPPVVTVMGHVDHGKTSLLDAIRAADVVSGEAGGITQHIGAYDVHHSKGVITFLDTPGHAAFTAMRARGAKVTDIVILVVAADDGVMPQTKEAIDHAKAAGVPIIVAINKIDKPDANADRVKRELSEYGVVTEEWGGDAICVPTSAKSKQGIDDLLGMILLQSEVLELKADPNGPAEGTIIEARLDKGRGPVATLLVQSGTINVGDFVVCGIHSGKVRALVNSHGQQVKEAGPSMPVEVVGLDGTPEAGDTLHVTTDDKVARMISENRQTVQRAAQLAANSRVTLEDLHRQMMEGEVQNLNIIVKADVFGSAEVIQESLSKLSNEKAKVSILHKGVGGITESDVMLAMASNAVIIGFHVVADNKAQKLAEQHHVEIKTYNIIYEMVDSVRRAMEGLLAPTLTEKVNGRAEVRQVFNVSKVGTIAGCMVISGKITRASKGRLLRDNVVIYTGDISSLKRFKDDAKEVQEGFECGIAIAGYNDLKPGDVVESFVIEESATKLD